MIKASSKYWQSLEDKAKWDKLNSKLDSIEHDVGFMVSLIKLIVLFNLVVAVGALLSLL